MSCFFLPFPAHESRPGRGFVARIPPSRDTQRRVCSSLLQLVVPRRTESKRLLLARSVVFRLGDIYRFCLFTCWESISQHRERDVLELFVCLFVVWGIISQVKHISDNSTFICNQPTPIYFTLNSYMQPTMLDPRLQFTPSSLLSLSFSLSFGRSWIEGKLGSAWPCTEAKTYENMSMDFWERG